MTAGPGDPGPAAGDHAATRGAARAGLAAGTAAGQPGRLLRRAGGWAGIRTAWCGRRPALAGAASGAGSGPDAAAQSRELAGRRAPVPCATVPSSPAASSRDAGLAGRAGG